MKASELIHRLQESILAFGDTDVCFVDYEGCFNYIGKMDTTNVVRLME